MRTNKVSRSIHNLAASIEGNIQELNDLEASSINGGDTSFTANINGEVFTFNNGFETGTLPEGIAFTRSSDGNSSSISFSGSLSS